MKKIMGIDTGGTYTDTVIISADTRQVLAKHKTPTEKTNLCESIEKGFNAMPEEMLKDISMVCLSTTLATNAIVEGHGCKNGLILIGSRPKGMLACRNVALVKGKFDIKGRVREQLDLEEIDRVIESFRGQVDSIAISGYASVRNPSHEIYVKNRIEEKLGIPVACAHELTSSLGFYDRTVTVDLNARLIPLLAELMDAVRSVMTERNLNVPLMVVKGDGSLMTEACARSKPIDTILSGPASSVIGGVFLSGEKDAFVIDMGGTTTDIADVTDGVARIRDEGARVGGWFTHVRATEVFTLGLGGDSRIYINSRGKITIGPEKSIPMTAAAERWPELIGELRHIRDCGSYKNFKFHDHEAYALIRKYEKLSYTDEEKILIEILRGGPRTKDYLKNNINMSKLQQLLDDLTKAGVVARISLTPTDILHLTGEYAMYDKHIAEIIVDIVAGLYGKECEEFIEEVCDLMRVKLDCAGIEAALYFDHHEVDMREGSTYDYFINSLFFDGGTDYLKANYSLRKRIVGIGAPACSWISRMGGCLDVDVVIPEHAEVANAVGAAVGRNIETIEVLIRPDSLTGKFVVYSPVSRVAVESLEEAAKLAVRAGESCVADIAEGREYSLDKDEEDLIYTDNATGNQIFLERVVKLTARFR